MKLHLPIALRAALLAACALMVCYTTAHAEETSPVEPNLPVATPDDPGNQPVDESDAVAPREEMATLTWNPSLSSGVWAVGQGAAEGDSPATWLAPEGVEDVNYRDGDIVIFGSAAEVSLADGATLSPADVLVANEEGTVTLSGASSRINGTLHKSGAGDLSLNVSLDGQLIIEEGRVLVSIEDDNVSDGVMMYGGTLALSGALNFASPLSVCGAGVLEHGEYSGQVTVISSDDMPGACLTLEAGATITGDVTVGAGAKLAGSLDNAASVILGESATITGDVTVGSSSSLSIGEGQKAAAIEGRLLLNGGLVEIAAAGQLEVGSLATGEQESTIRLKGSSYAYSSVVNLISYGNADSFDSGKVRIEDIGDPSRREYSLFTDDGILKLAVNGQAATLLWDNSKEEGVWDLGETGSSWLSPDGSVSDTSFYQQDNVIFENQSKESTVVVSIASGADGKVITPGSIIVRGEGDTEFYTNYNDVCGLSGAFTITKEGSGTLFFDIADNGHYSGKILIKEGTVEAGGSGAFGSLEDNGSHAQIELAGGKLDMGEWNHKNDISVTGKAELAGAQGNTGTLTLDSGELSGDELHCDVILKSGSLANGIQSGSITKETDGVATLTGSVSTEKDSHVNAGILVIKGDLFDSKAIVAKGAELKAGELPQPSEGGDGSAEAVSVTLKGLDLESGATATLASVTVTDAINMKEGSVLNILDSLELSSDCALTVTGGKVDGDIALNGGRMKTAGISTIEGDMTLEAGELVLSDDQSIAGTLTLNGGVIDLTSGATLSADKFVSTKEPSPYENDKTEVRISLSNLKPGEVFTLIKLNEPGEETENVRDLVTVSGLEHVRGDGLVATDDGSLAIMVDSQNITWAGGTGDQVWDFDTSNWLTSGGIDDTFHNLDNVDFGTIRSDTTITVKGEAQPGSIKVDIGETEEVNEGNVETRPLFLTFTADSTDGGSFAGSGSLTKTGEGYLVIDMDNSSYSGDIHVTGGGLTAVTDNAWGTGSVYVQDADLRANGVNDEQAGYRASVIANKDIILDGECYIYGLQNASKITFNDKASICGIHSLEVGKELVVKGSCSFEGSVLDDGTLVSELSFNGGALTLGGTLDLTKGTAVRFSTDPDQGRSFALTLTVLDGTEEAVVKLPDTFVINGEESSDYTALASLLAYDEDLYEGSWADGVFTLKAIADNPPVIVADVSRSLNRNQRAAYGALKAIAGSGEATGALGALAEEVATSTDAVAVRSLLDKVDGAALATAMSSQVEGNLAHMRRLRDSIGTGQALLEGKLAAWVQAYNDDHTVSSDGHGLGYRRTEWGATLGIEGQVCERVTLGGALGAGRANVSPSGSERYHEDSLHADLYAVARFGGWQSVTAVGFGCHSFDLSRSVGAAHASADSVEGLSLNILEEVNYTFKLGESDSLQPFFAVESSVNQIESFSESGAGDLSLRGSGRHAWATDLTLGLRYLHGFAAVSGAPSATLSVQAGLVASVGDTTDDLSLAFVGAPGEGFTVSGADRNRWGYNIGASLVVPVSGQTALYGSAGTVLRGDSSEFNAQVGVRCSF